MGFCFVPGFLWAFNHFILGFSNMFYGYIRSIRALLGYWRGIYKSKS